MDEPRLKREALMIIKMTGGDLLKLHDLLDRQFTVLQSRAQVLVSIAGIVVTVTGFSGRVIAASNPLGQWLVIAGLFAVICSAVFTIVRVLRINWLTALLPEDTDSAGCIAGILKIRDRKHRAFRYGGVMLLAGLVCYSLAVAIMLLHHGQ